MGAKNSKPKCKVMNCESQVKRVMDACSAAGSRTVDATHTAVTTAIFGPVIANAANEALGSLEPDPWLTSYVYTRPSNPENSIIPDDSITPESNGGIAGFTNYEFYTNYEGFKEGNSEECVSCSCEQAADTIIARCNEVSTVVPASLVAAITEGDKMLSPETEEIMYKLVDDEEEKLASDFYERVIAPGIKPTDTITNDTITNDTITDDTITNDTFTNIKEGFELQFINDAITARANRFQTAGTNDIPNCRPNGIDTTKTFIATEMADLDKLYHYYNTYLNNYDTVYIHRQSVAKIVSNRIEELDKLQSKIDKYKMNLHVDDRKNIYQDRNYESYKYIYNFIVLAYYGLFILYLIVSKFFSEKQYYNKKVLIILFIYLIIPIILNHIINLSYEGYNYVLESNNLKEDTKSYVDIIKDN